MSDGTDSVMLSFDPSQPLGATGSVYYLTVSAMTSAAGKVITTGAGNTLGMVFTATDLSDVYVFPHPVHLATDKVLTFANLTNTASIEVFDQSFTSLLTLRTSDANGGLQWNITDATGAALPPGIYYYRATGTNDAGATVTSPMRKLVLLR
jgi:hypothetical protein